MNSTDDPPAVIFFGMFGMLSAIPLQGLIDRGCRIRAIVMPVSPLQRRAVTISEVSPETMPVADAMLQSYDQRTIVHVAWEYGIPLLEVGRLSSRETRAVLSSYQPDVLCVSCFPWRLPSSILHIPTCGALNLHPSLLPAYRGPNPLFWVFRKGEEETGVTVHLMDEALDTGDIITQYKIPLPDGITGHEAEQACARAGGPLMADAVYDLVHGTATSYPQDERRSSYYARPSPEDLIITPEWPACRAYNFICGVTGRTGGVEVGIGVHRFQVRKAVGWRDDETLGQPFRRSGERLEVQCSPGILEVVS